MADPVVPPEQTPVTPAPEAPAASAAAPAAAAPPPEANAAPPAAEAPKTVAETPSLIEGATSDTPKPEEGDAGTKPDAAAKPPEGEKPTAEGAKPDAAAKPPEGETPKLDKDGKPIVEAKPDAATPDPLAPVPGTEPVKYEAYTLPEGIEIPAAELTKVNDLFGRYRIPQAAAQELVDMHAQAFTNYAQHLASEQQRVFGETRKQWRNEIMADEVLGGAGHQTAMGVVARMRDRLIPAEEREAFNQFTRITGAGDHPVFVRMLHRAGLMLDEPAPAPTPHAPPPDAGRSPKGRRGVLYDHPTSARNRQQ